MRSRIEPMKHVAKMLRRHKELILHWFAAEGQLSSGAVEGLNLKAKLTMRKAYGLQSLEHLQIALYHTLGSLPEPPGGPHRCCRAIFLLNSHIGRVILSKMELDVPDFSKTASACSKARR